jgi:hypothetical protein
MTDRKILIGLLIGLGIYLLLKKKGSWFNAAYAPADKAGAGADVAASDDYYTASGGSGYVAGGVDDTASQAADPDSFYTDSIGDSAPIVGDVTSGLSGSPAVGMPWVGVGFNTPVLPPSGRIPASVSELSVGTNPALINQRM